jgi:hypothetical protein
MISLLPGSNDKRLSDAQCGQKKEGSGHDDDDDETYY